MQNAAFTGRRGLSALLVALPLILLLGTMQEAMAVEQKVVEALYQSAKKEGQITIYSPNEQVLQGLEKEFPRAFPGIEVKWTQAEPTDLATKLITEKRSGQVKADLAFGSLSSRLRSF
jgi:ABC-type glycerol-3-phosphate transport system substrate-binding protein